MDSLARREPVTSVPVNRGVNSVASDKLTYHRIESGDPDVVGVVDFGSGSVKLEIFERTNNGLKSLFKRTYHYGLGKDISPLEIEEAKLNSIAMQLTLNEAIPQFRLDFIEWNVGTTTAYATEAVRLACKSRIKNLATEAQNFVILASQKIGFPIIVASEKLEITLSIDAATLKGAPKEIAEQGIESAVIDHGGGASIQKIHLLGGYVVKDHQSVVHAGAYTLHGPLKEVDATITKVTARDAPWASQVKHENVCFAGGMFREPARVLGLIRGDINPATKDFPPEGYHIKIKSKKDLANLKKDLLTSQRATAEELFHRGFGSDKKTTLKAIAIAEAKIITQRNESIAKAKGKNSKIKKADERAKSAMKEETINIDGKQISLKDIRARLKRWEKRVESRYKFLATDVQYILNRIDFMYGDGSKLPKGGVTLTFSMGSTRRAAAFGAPQI